MEPNINRNYKGLYQDSSKSDQPEGTYTFALNAVTETELGDSNFLSNELGNELCSNLPEGSVPIGNIYMGDNTTVILLAFEDEKTSEIGILDKECNYKTVVNDRYSADSDKLGFKITNQIQGFYRLRRGCERTIYFTDNLNRPYYFNFDNLDEFKNSNGTWNKKKFYLQKAYSKIPRFKDIEVLDTGGNLEPGSYNIAIQYVDDDLNPTEWITTSPIIKIYNDLTHGEFRDITGSINSEADYLNFPPTSKSIRVEVNNLDGNYLFYRLAFIEATSGTGQVTSVKVSETIPTTKDYFIYTGTNTVSSIPEIEVAMFNDIIEKAKTISHLENRLFLGNTEGKNVNSCVLQKYASRIKVDCISKKINLNDLNIDKANPKNAVHEVFGLGYQPGEIYSLGIVYIYEDGQLSPVFHIPGKNPNLSPNLKFATGDDIYPMDVNNQINTPYTEKNSCGNSSYWGRDSEGETLKNKPVRHHRFPLRSKINLPLIEDEMGEEVPQLYYNLVMIIEGELKTFMECENEEEDCTPHEVEEFEVRLTYLNQGETFQIIERVNPEMYETPTGTYEVALEAASQFHNIEDFTVVSIEITDENGDFQMVGEDVDEVIYNNQFGDYFVGSSEIKTEVREHNSIIKGRSYYTNILGLHFSGIDLPAVEETNGQKITGYYIVRNERTDFDKTILDSGVIIPTVVNDKYISHGLLAPETNRVSKEVFSIIHPEHKFNNKEFYNYDSLIQEGEFEIKERYYGKVNYDDVYDGSSYNPKIQKKGNDDGHEADGSPTSRGFDGWSLNVISRDNIVSFKTKKGFVIDKQDIKDTFYLDALEHKSIDDYTKDVYNISSDNKIGMINIEDGTIPQFNNKYPYVLFKKENVDVYSNFRNLPYYKQSLNPEPFYTTTGNSCTVFAGDVFTSPMRYVNTVFYDNRIAKRKGKSSALKKVFGAVLAVIGGVLAFTPLAGVGAVVIGAGITLMGAGALIFNSGLKMDNYNRAYGDEYDKGLRKTSLDNWVDAFYNYRDNSYTQAFEFSGGATGRRGGYGKTGPSDDTIQWIGDCITDLWFETTVNTNLRTHMFRTDSPTFLNAPGKIESGNDSTLITWEFFGHHYMDSNAQRYPISSLERHLVKKLLAFDDTRDDNRLYLGIALGEFYFINPDYNRRNKQKYYFHLPLEYKCCSDCQESFPHRWHWSEQSFQEELSDNYRVFLPNNYKDISGETGEIVNIVTFGNELYLHTREAFWLQPRNYQERVTDQVVSFIGSGEFGEMPERKIVDDRTGLSAGLQHQFATLVNKYGYFFPSGVENKFYQFDGKSMFDISSVGLKNWFKNNMPSEFNKEYYKIHKYDYENLDNPSSNFGTGFTLAYDSRYERLLLTKKDFVLRDGVLNPTSIVTSCNNKLIEFQNFEDIKNSKEADGWTYEGIENCQLKFKKIITETVIEEREKISTSVITNTTDVHIFLDTSGSFGTQNGICLESIRLAVENWLTNFENENPSWEGELFVHYDSTERWVTFPKKAVQKYASLGINDLTDKDVVIISFCNETSPAYHGNDLTNTIEAPKPNFITDYNEFVDTIYNRFKSFIGVNYPIAFGQNSHSCGYGSGNIPSSKAMVQQCIASIYGETYTNSEFDDKFPIPNPGFSTQEWNQLRNSFSGPNPYSEMRLKDYGWTGKWDRHADSEGNVITPEQFNIDIEELLRGQTDEILVTEEVEVLREVAEYSFIEGIELDTSGTINHSWTISYNLETVNRKPSWVSWHSYLPNFYISRADEFISWSSIRRGLWKHNTENVYQTFYEIFYPHIIEYISLSHPIMTRVWDSIKLLTEAKEFNEDMREYFDRRFITFNRAVLYNSRQCSGHLDLVVKDIDSDDYLRESVVNALTSVISRNERDWRINDFRDIRTDYEAPIWISNKGSLQGEYYIDKVLNYSSLDENKDWTELESFRDKFLAVRLIFDKFANIKLITNYSIEAERHSSR